jgi:hypothetical protein
MTFRRLAAIAFIFGVVTLAWMILATSILLRTQSGYDVLGEEVQDLWGAPQRQGAPQVTLVAADGSTSQAELQSSDIQAGFHLQPRRKGLLWYATYDVTFDGRYLFRNPLGEPVTARVLFRFPTSSAIYDDFEFRVADTTVSPQGDTGQGLQAEVQLPAGQEAPIHIAYKSRGLDSWLYSFADEITTVRNFTLTASTDFREYDFPQHTISATTKTPTQDGWRLQWRFENLVSDFDIGIGMPHRLNPGPLASRMSYFAPISLLFFFTVLVVMGAVQGRSLHPMHYFFLSASFFSFHILFAYLVDHLLLELSFLVAAAVSMTLVITYLWRAVGWRFALIQAGISQLLFLILFSYAFFFEGYTGLIVTVGAVVTLAALMHLTARVDWADVFRRKEPPSAADDRRAA